MTAGQKRITVLSLCLALVVGGVGWSILSRASPDETFSIALVALEQGELAVVRAAADELSSASGYEPHNHLLRGALQRRAGRAELALDHFRHVTPVDELRKPVLLETGACLYQLGRLSESEAVFLQLADEFPDDADPHRWLASIYYDISAMEQALDELEVVKQLAPEDYRPYRLAGLIYFDFERYSEATVEYNGALDRQPPSNVRADVVGELTQSLIELRSYTDVLELHDNESPQADAELLALRALCYWNLGEPDLAQELLRQARDIDAGDREVLMLTARIALDERRAGDAVRPLRELLRRAPHDVEARYQLAQTYLALGRQDEYETEIERKNASEELINAVHELNIQAIGDPGNAEIRDRLAALCDELGRTELADMWRRAADACREMSQSTTPPAPE